MNPLRLAVGTLTAIRVPAPRTVDGRVAGAAMLLAPLAVLPVVALAAGALAVVGGGLLGAVLAVGVGALGTRGMHLDGLADTADGLSASYDRGRALDVMRKGDVGPSGVAAVVLVILAQVAALAGTPHGVFAAVVALLTGRLVLVLCCARGVPAARPDGLGATVAGSVGRGAAAVALAAGVALAAAASLLTDLPPWRGALAVVAGCLLAGLLLAHCVRRFGGITGDVLGACVETGTLGALLALAVG